MSLPTILVAFARYSRDGSFVVLGGPLRFMLVTAAGSIVGEVLGACCWVFSKLVLIPELAVALLVSSIELAPHA
ncbi:hypothetical protein ACFV2V_23905 [Streptomyces sp. NPDC059698]|uniref:hypothetical protein n=1 Tax=unclassified Streptomyces TaxID=2593676 RepID=UPI00093A35BD|nr:hypothetical protein [Streptomyces sp. CB02366]OKJ32694.1 hypothetical protein AMK24_26310 [Streptomyces sp. CB02366]